MIAVIVVSSAAITLQFFKQNNLALPRTVVGNISVSGMTREEIRQAITNKIKAFNGEKFQMAAGGTVTTITMQDLGASINETLILNEIPFAGEMENPAIVLWSIAGQRIMPRVYVEQPDLLRVIDEKFPNLPKVKNAHFSLKGKRWNIVEAQTGVTPNLDPLALQINQHVAFLEISPVFVDFKDKKPTIMAADLKAYESEIKQIFPKTLQLTYDKQKWNIDFGKHPEWIVFEKKKGDLSPGELPFSMEMDPVALAQFLRNGVATILEQLPENVRIWHDENGKIQFDGHAIDGMEIEQERLLNLINAAIASEQKEVAIPLAVVSPRVDVSEDLRAMGIRQLIGVGHSRFQGSPVNRTHNIGVGVAKFNGLLIASGETFSFDKNLGKVDASTGYRKELVIKPEGTIPDYGGGLCQISTTMYRAALDAGMPIVDRTPHSYAVTYYSQVGGHGLDATIYPPSRDLKFTNDTPDSILIQSYVDGYDAFFKFYGTSDGRKVSLEGPYISNRVGAPAEVITIYDSALQPGEKKQVEKPHAGFDVLWYRYITKGSDSKKEEIFTRYQAIPAKFTSGDQVTPEGENQALQ